MFYVITFLILLCGFGLYLLDTEKNPKRMNLDDLKDKLRKLWVLNKGKNGYVDDRSNGVGYFYNNSS